MMNHTMFGLAALLFTGVVGAQQGASTLSALAANSDVITVAHVAARGETRAATAQTQMTSVRFSINSHLKGRTGGTITLIEPKGRCCTRALSERFVGEQVLLFCKRGPGGTMHLTAGGLRSVLSLGPARRANALVRHVSKLLAAPTELARLDHLLAAMNAMDPRIAQDAVHAVSVHPALHQATLRTRPTIARSVEMALRTDLATDGHSLADLIRCAERLQLRTVVEPLVEATLHGRLPLSPRGIAATLNNLDAPSATRHALRVVTLDPGSASRCVQLLSHLETADAQVALAAIAAERAIRPQARQAAVTALSRLREQSPDSPQTATIISNTQSRGARTSAKPTFRSIDPRRKSRN